MSKSNFNCSQSVFVLVVETILNSMQRHLEAFTNFRPKYKLSWITTLRTMLAAAAALPDEAARQAASSILRSDLVDQNMVCCALWQKLSAYISGAYPAKIVSIQLNAAGHAKYRSAYENNWADAKSMYTSAKTFLTANLATLTADENMSPAFSDEFSNAVDLFMEILQNYESSKEAIPLATQRKVVAFNEVHAILIPMTKDGQKIFRDNEAIKTQFVFENVVDRISGPGLAGARGTITNANTAFPIAGVLVSISLASDPATFYTATTDSNGFYLINCPSGEYKLNLTAEGFEPFTTKTIKIAVGTVSAFDERLIPLLMVND